ncbi:MAG: DNA mismatch repair endonuclease MutL [Tissierellales bacterium]|nr:DNA mismatch repair endonuclease MutL [Tissierellales bacterium]
MARINLLDDNTIMKIAAGEVIERPASIVKELIENSIDANARRITIEIRDGGTSFIRVTDDGEGMDKDDLELAFKRHATSKLRTIDDLYKIVSMGFRGEALSSIIAVAEVEVISKTANNDVGNKAIFKNGNLKNIENVATTDGTTMIVKNVFENLPVRKKFLKSNATEERYIVDIVTKLALGNPQISFKLIKDGKLVLNTNGTSDEINIIYQLLGKEISKGMNFLKFEEEDFKFRGYFSNNNIYRSNKSYQYLYVNNRYVYDYKLTKVIEEQYTSILPINKHPIFILYIDIDPSLIDVNIHPTKQEIKFVEENKVYSLISNHLRININKIINIPNPNNVVDKKPDNSKYPYIWEINKNNNTEKRENDFQVNENSLFDFIDYTTKDFKQNLINPTNNKEYDSTFLNKNDSFKASTDEKYYENDNKILSEFNNLKYIGIAFNTYIFFEDSLSETIYIIDQHASHERIMYEKLLNQYKNESITIQNLLVPQIIELSPSEYLKAVTNIDQFNNIGFSVEVFDEKSVILRGIPLVFGNPNGEGLFLDILDIIEEKEPDVYSTNIEKIMKIACTSAVKAGDNLKKIEVDSLIRELGKCDNPYTCPHGRPTVIKFYKKDLEKKFLRII